MKKTIGIGLSGQIEATVYKKNGDVVSHHNFHNAVLDIGFENLVKTTTSNIGSNVSYYPSYLFLGTGSTEPLETDLGLENRSETLGSQGASGSSLGGTYAPDDGEISVSRKITFEYGEGEAEGVWSELGLSFTSSYSEPYSRALFRDENDIPTTIQVLSDEYLKIVYTIYMHFPAQPVEGTFPVNGVDRTYRTTVMDDVVNGSFDRTNPWYCGLPCYLYSYEETPTEQTRTVSEDGMSIDYTFTYAPGDDVAFTMNYIGFKGSRYNVSYSQTQIRIYLDPPIEKLASEKMTGQITLSYARIPVEMVGGA